MSYFSDISLRRAASLFMLVLGVLVGGTWATIKITAEQVLNRDARETASEWANFLAANIADLKQIADGEQPSRQSLAFFEAARAAGHVFRYTIYNPQGYSQLVADAHGVSFVDISILSPEAIEAVRDDLPVADMKSAESSASSDVPRYFSEAFVPVRVDGRPVAVVAAYVDETSRRANFYQGITWASLALCGLIGLSFGIPTVAWYLRTREKQRADRRIRFLAHHDVLTGLANRARLTERLAAALSVLPTSGALIAVHYIDLDYFKQVNDRHGHLVGSRLLYEVGYLIKAQLRLIDFAFRYGGDEFVVLLPQTTKDQAVVVAKRLQDSLRSGTFCTEQGLNLNVRASMGLATFPHDAQTPHDIIRQADEMMYVVKNTTRDNIGIVSRGMLET